MSITIQLEAPAENVLRERAEAAGLTLENFVLLVLNRESERATRYHPKLEALLPAIEKLRGKRRI